MRRVLVGALSELSKLNSPATTCDTVPHATGQLVGDVADLGVGLSNRISVARGVEAAL
jgi:hypothetical protein